MNQLWSQDDGLTDVTSAFQGITAPVSEVIDDIHRRGWTVGKIQVKDGHYVAEGKNPHGEKLEAVGRTDATAAANLLVKIMRREFMRAGAIREKLGAWDHRPLEQQFATIAMAYAQAPVYQPAAAPAWMELAQDCSRRAQIIRTQVKVELTNDPVPYESANDLREDVTQKKHILVSRAFAHHPVWSEAQMLDYRLVVDVLGHAASGGDWGWHGTCLAFAQLAPLLAESPQKALFTELLGQGAFGQFYRQWGPQKIAFLDLAEEAQGKENKPGHTGVHPSQSLVPAAIPSIFSRVAAQTRTQLLREKQELDNEWPDRTEVVHQWPDGWSVRRPSTYADIHRQGELLANCLSLNSRACAGPYDEHPDWPRDEDGNPVDSQEALSPDDYRRLMANLNVPIPDAYRLWKELSLHDPDGLPRAVWTERGRMVDNVLGRHNSMPKPEYLKRISDYAQQHGMAPVGIDNVSEELEDYPDPTDWEDHRQAAVIGTPTDPNANWQSGIAPLQDNAYLWQRQDGVDPLDAANLTEGLRPLDVGISRMHPAQLKQAVVNALRSSLLGTRNNAMGHAIHYQTLHGIPAEVDDPMAYWDALEQAREGWNTTQGYAPGSHKQYWPEEQQFKQWVKAMNPQLDDGDVQRLAKRELVHMLAEEEERILAQDQGEQLPAEVVEHEAYEAIRRRLKALTKPNVDQKVDFGEDHLWHEAAVETECQTPDAVYNTEIGPKDVKVDVKLPCDLDLDEDQAELLEKNIHNVMELALAPHFGTFHADMYPPYLTSRLRPLAQISRHANALAEAAKEDLLQHKGHGHHFRATTLSLGIPGLGPRQASHAWLYLAPQTSQLGVINPEIAEILGHNYATDTTNRDYFKHERELAAGRDAAGYNHVPLGPFSAGIHDLYMGGPGWHPDRTPFKVQAPLPHSNVDWQAQTPAMTGWTSPYWWESTQAARDGAAQDFDRSVGVNFPRDEVPFRRMAAAAHQLHWTEGKEGKGLVIPTEKGAEFHTWSGGEHHAEYASHLLSDGMGELPVEGVDFTDPITISPEGWYTTDTAAPTPNISYFGAYQPGLKYVPDIDKWDRRVRGSTSGRSPWVTNPSTGERLTGAPGTSLMQHVKDSLGHPDCQSVWVQEYEVGKGEPRTAKTSGSHPLDNSEEHEREIICPECNGTTVRPDGERCYWCHGTGMTHGGYPNRPARYIGHYERVTRYGGPEEGGWHYTDYPHKRSMFIPKEWQGREDELADLLKEMNKGQHTEYRMGPGEYNQEGTYWADDPDFWRRHDEEMTPQEQDIWDNDVETGQAHYILEHEPGEHHAIQLPGIHWDDSGGYLHGAKNDPDYGTEPRVTDPFLRLPPPPNPGTFSKVATAQVMYHVAPQRHRDSIAQYGLDASKGERMWPGHEYPAATYLYPHWESAYAQALNHHYGPPDPSDPDNAPWRQEPVDVYRVRTDGLNLSPDPLMSSGGSYMVQDPIEPHRVSVIPDWETYDLESPDEFE